MIGKGHSLIKQKEIHVPYPRPMGSSNEAEDIESK